MTIEQTDIVDAIGVDKVSGGVILTVTDHLLWSGDEVEHLRLLQNKINSYLRFVESGEIFEVYPDAKGRNVSVRIVGKHPLSQEAESFLERANRIARPAGMPIRFELFEEK